MRAGGTYCFIAPELVEQFKNPKKSNEDYDKFKIDMFSVGMVAVCLAIDSIDI